MTEPLFVCEMIWIVVWLVEWRASSGCRPAASRPLAMLDCAALVAAIFTRYDGWIMALLAWTCMGSCCCAAAACARAAFWLASVFVVAAPMAWFVYNAAAFGDWLYFRARPVLRQGHRNAHRRRTGWPAASGLAQSLGLAALFYEGRGDGRGRRGMGQRAARAEPAGNGVGLAHRAPARLSRGRCCCGFRFPFMHTRWPMARCRSFCPSGGRTPGTTRATEWNCCPPWRWAWALPRSSSSPRCASSSRGIGQAFAAGVLFALVGLERWQMVRERPLTYVEGTKNIEARRPYRTRDSACLAVAAR